MRMSRQGQDYSTVLFLEPENATNSLSGSKNSTVEYNSFKP
jgi:hypothetical protein